MYHQVHIFHKNSIKSYTKHTKRIIICRRMGRVNVIKPSISVRNLGVTFSMPQCGICLSISVVTYAKLSISIFATYGEYAVSSPRIRVIMLSEHLSCPALTVLVRFYLALMGLISGGCGASGVGQPGLFLHVDGTGALSSCWIPCVGSKSRTLYVSK